MKAPIKLEMIVYENMKCTNGTGAAAAAASRHDLNDVVQVKLSMSFHWQFKRPVEQTNVLMQTLYITD